MIKEKSYLIALPLLGKSARYMSFLTIVFYNIV